MKVYHFMRYKWWFLGSLTAVTVFAVVAIFVVGLDFGIDFKGGTRLQVTLEQTDVSVDEVRQVVADAGVFEPVVQSWETATGDSGFLITSQELSDEEIAGVKDSLASAYGLNEEATGSETVGASFGKNTTNMAFIAVAIAIVFIIAYMWWRFELKFALPAILALVHDVGLALGIYAATGRLVTAATVAAILTILGYSVHDTIIIYDRMRENTLLMKKETYGDMVDLSIRQTMVRSINTTIAILLPLLAILFFGGPTLKDFAMALTIGVVAGTYSSFFVAAPLVTIWKEREPQFKKRLAAANAANIASESVGNTQTVSPKKAGLSTGGSGGKSQVRKNAKKRRR